MNVYFYLILWQVARIYVWHPSGISATNEKWIDETGLLFAFSETGAKSTWFFRAHICDCGSTSCSSSSSIAHDLINQRRTDHLKCASCANCEINRKKNHFWFCYMRAHVCRNRWRKCRYFWCCCVFVFFLLSSLWFCYCAQPQSAHILKCDQVKCNVWEPPTKRKNPSKNAIKIQ